MMRPLSPPAAETATCSFPGCRPPGGAGHWAVPGTALLGEDTGRPECLSVSFKLRFLSHCMKICSGAVWFDRLVAACCLPLTASSSSGRDRQRGRGGGGGGGCKTPSRRTPPSHPTSTSPAPPLPPPRPPLRSRRKSKSPSSRSTRPTPKGALDLDQIGPSAGAGSSRRTQKGSRDLCRSQDSELDSKWEDVTLELRYRGGRMRSAVYQTSDLPSMVKSKRQAEQSEGPAQMDRSKPKATFV